jgi:tRNA U34 5-carboxymethylaminomethyl modifying enzyme MnmG/GidA
MFNTTWYQYQYQALDLGHLEFLLIWVEGSLARRVVKSILIHVVNSIYVHREQEPSMAWRAREQARIPGKLIYEKNSSR